MNRNSFLFVSCWVLFATLTNAAAGSVAEHGDLPYKVGPALSSYEEDRCKLDLYLPAEADSAPVLVWFHGGGLRNGDKRGADTVALGQRMASRGVVVAAVNYRLSPRAPYPEYLYDAGAAVAWVLDHIDEHGGDPARVFVGGHSAGGYLTMMVGLDGRYVAAGGGSANDIAGLIPVSGQMVTHSTVRGERGIAAPRMIVDEAAPLYHVRKIPGSVLNICGDADLPARREENVLVTAWLKAAGHADVRLLTVAGRDHGTIMNRIAEPNDRVALEMLQFIQSPRRAEMGR